MLLWHGGSVGNKTVNYRPFPNIRMKLFNLCIVAIFLSTAVNGDTDQCPLYGIDYQGYDIDSIREIFSWEECGYLCHITSGCNYWTWGKDGVNINTCFLKSDNAGIENQDNVISGSKDCYNWVMLEMKIQQISFYMVLLHY